MQSCFVGRAYQPQRTRLGSRKEASSHVRLSLFARWLLAPKLNLEFPSVRGSAGLGSSMCGQPLLPSLILARPWWWLWSTGQSLHQDLRRGRQPQETLNCSLPHPLFFLLSSLPHSSTVSSSVGPLCERPAASQGAIFCFDTPRFVPIQMLFDLLVVSAAVLLNSRTAAAAGTPCQSVSSMSAAFMSVYPSATQALVPAQAAEDCLKSVPIDKDEDLALIDEMQLFINWQSKSSPIGLQRT